MILTLKKKVLIGAIIGILLVVGIGIYFTVKATSAKPNLAPVVVIDAGHGGKDGGAVGDQSIESELNLDYALTLKDLFQQFGFRVVLTRKDMGGLYSPFASNKKRSEMEKRKKIIENTNPDLVISLHMNSFASSSVRGAQVFYAESSDAGQQLAQSVQTQLNKNVEYAKKTAKIGDYYILNCTENPSVLVECGYVSNPEEERLLLDEKYRHSFCYNILCGVLLYFEM